MNQLAQHTSERLCPAVLDSQNLLAAWEKVEENAGGAGVDGISIAVFSLTLDRELALLQGELSVRLQHAALHKAWDELQADTLIRPQKPTAPTVDSLRGLARQSSRS